MSLQGAQGQQLILPDGQLEMILASPIPADRKSFLLNLVTPSSPSSPFVKYQQPLDFSATVSNKKLKYNNFINLKCFLLQGYTPQQHENFQNPIQTSDDNVFNFDLPDSNTVCNNLQSLYKSTKLNMSIIL